MNDLEKPDLCQLNEAELKAAMDRMGQPAFRAVQVFQWLHQKKAADFGEMTNLSAKLRQELAEQYRITVMEPLEVYISRLDGTRKYVFGLFDGNAIEAVLMRYHHGNAVCISSQVGCRMGCRFCASTLDGCVRNLTTAEMLAEVYRIERDLGERISNVVIMGSGEPLDNYDEVVGFLRRVTDEKGLHISARNITLSTCGLPDGIRRLAEERLPVTLALSLHAPTQGLRQEIMPIARAHPLEEVLAACRTYALCTGRRISFEYAVVRDVNDTRDNAMLLAKLLRDHGFTSGISSRGKQKLGGREGLCHVNLIPVNPIAERDYRSPDRSTVEAFQHFLQQQGINATIRREMGRDISSACGQLRRRYKDRHAGTGSH